MDGMPFLEMAANYKFSEPDFLAVSVNPVIQRYADIIKAFLDSERPTHLIHARFRIAEQAKKHGVRVGDRGKKPTLTDCALDHIPEFWLKTMYPDIGDRSSGEFFSSIDNITRGRGAITSYALALAVLFDSSEEALKYWYDDIDGLPSQRKVQRKFGEDYWNSSEIFRLYVKNGGSYRNIGDEIEVDPSYVGSELKAAGLPSLNMIYMRATAQAILDFQAGMSLEAACESNSASIEEVEKLLRGGVSRLANAIKEITHPKIRKNAKSPKKN